MATFLYNPITGVLDISASQTGGGGDVSGPGTSTVGDIATWSDVTGTTLADSGVAFPIPLASGGTSKALTADNGGIVYSDANSMEILAHTTTANQALLSGSSAAPAWSTATYPATTTINQILYSSAADTIGGLATANNAILVTNGSGVPSLSTSLPSGIPGTLTWSVVTVNATFSVNTGVIANKAGTLAMALPTTSAVGDVIEITGINTALGWQITQAAGQQIFCGNVSTTLGATGTLTSSAIRDSVRLVCVVANTTWNMISSVGNLTTA